MSTEALKFLEELEMQRDIEAYDAAIERHKKEGSKTISHEEMMKRLDHFDVDASAPDCFRAS
ncbi:MAG: hypothetical protein E6Q59_00930 [Nitrosomonas sp.]|nr:MAG: hypothetical protein E6Q59_00930 [Nitrosomonas sp.]